ncbi:MAG: NAD(P)/FAD-dependent oxidoreductase [Saprospiraceae bacterium]
MPHITIIGGGVIGLCSAYYLVQENCSVTLIERNAFVDGCSFGNAGMIVPSHFIPLAAPGMIEQGIRWMFNAESPFFVKPRLSWELFSWGWEFHRAATQKRVTAAAPALRDLSLLSKSLYHELAQQPGFQFSFEEKGLMMLCKSEHTLAEEAAVAEQANALGIEARVLSKAALNALEPEIKPEVAGAVFYPGDAHLHPNAFMQQMREYLIGAGVEILAETAVLDFEFRNKRITQLKINQTGKEQSLPVDELLLASGAWSQNLGRALRLNLPIQAGKGYSFTLPQREGQRLRFPSILAEARVAITPMADQFIRFGGTMEIGGLNETINLNRVRGIVKAIPQYFNGYAVEMPREPNIWHGLRPCSPDGLPYIGRSHGHDNLSVATGHAMMGLSLAPATGKLISEVMMGKAPSVGMGLFEVGRYERGS